MVSSWIKNIVEQTSKSSKIKIGMIIKHKDGRNVKILSGQYWGDNGLSNFWRWQEAKSDGSFGSVECGYGNDLRCSK